MRAFVKLRQILASHVELARKLEALEKKYDSQFNVVFKAMRQLMAPKEMSNKRIGFQLRETSGLFCKGIDFGWGHEKPFVKNKDATPQRARPPNVRPPNGNSLVLLEIF